MVKNTKYNDGSKQNKFEQKLGSFWGQDHNQTVNENRKAPQKYPIISAESD